MKQLILLISVFWIACADVDNLGNNFYYDGQEIIKSNPPMRPGNGSSVVPPTINKIHYDDRYIVAHTENMKGRGEYWFIDKRENEKQIKYREEDSLHWGYYEYTNIKGPLDSSEFLKILADKKIQVPTYWRINREK